MFLIGNMAEPTPLTDPISLGVAVRRARRDQGLTQEELALVADVGRRFVIELEAGKSSAQVGAVLRVLSALGGGIVVSRMSPHP
jgi:y4mF family transcriptional regulator